MKHSGIVETFAHRAAIGIGCSSFFYLLILSVFPTWIPPTRLSILTLFVMGAVDGALVFILSSTKFAYVMRLVLHCCATLVTAMAWLAINQIWEVFTTSWWIFLIVFVLIYALVWIGVLIRNRKDADEINEVLRARETQLSADDIAGEDQR